MALEREGWRKADRAETIACLGITDHFDGSMSA